jgi:RsiW-degrading membrane proteinase PrsW (M82 family)/uncharacterized protein (UPF0305 family)
MSESAYVLLLALVVAVLYLAIVRFIDLNEREPLWSVALLFVAGGVSALLLNLLVSSRVLELTIFPAAVAEEVAKFIALAAGVALLSAIARLRGWSEIQGIMDGIVYGVAAGLGFATAGAVIRELRLEDMPLDLNFGPLVVLWTTALSGLAHGVFAAISGAGIGAAVRTRGPGIVYAAAGLGGAIAANVAFRFLAYGGSLGPEALLRTWIALLLPLLFLIVVVAYELARERRVIRDELTGESETVSEADLALLQSFASRQAQYLAHLARGDFSRGSTLMALQNRQVQLALAKRRQAEEPDPERRAEIAAEVERLRAEVRKIKSALQRVSQVLAICAVLTLGSAFQQAGVALAQDDGRYHAPVEGSMRDLIQETVGSFTLDGVKYFVEMLEEGASDAVVLLYRSADGVEIHHIVSAFSSREASGAYLVATSEGLTSQGWTLLETGRLRNESGEEIGNVIQLVDQASPLSCILWSNEAMFVLLTGPKEYVRDFYTALPY